MKVTSPKLLDVPEAAETVSFELREEESVTVLPLTGFEFASRRVTVMIDVVVPLAVIELELEVTVERVGF